MLTPILADGGGVLTVLFIVAFIVVPAIIKAVKKAKEDQQRTRSRGGESESHASSPGDELTSFLNSLSGKRGASHPARASRPAAQGRPKRAIPVARPAPAATAREEPRTLRDAGPARSKRRAPEAPSAQKTTPMPGYEPATPGQRLAPLPDVEVVEQKTGADALAAVLAGEPVQQAIVLREILGPCRAMRRHRIGRW